ncbi:YlxR family protein [Microlunatus soli]|uniref:YlxR domain-containing protein n=1 Tax=Microlunatus soli TaxID=630515 RepID=A0A1H1NS55_9ACTN|nr:hypothetical protein SAMN04489812_0620 [Microlunatus soli]
MLAARVDSADVEPVRTCVGCRGRENKADLLRLTVVGGAIRVDQAQRRPGRGVYLHPRPSCWDQAFRKRALTRGLRAPTADPSPASEDLRRLTPEGDDQSLDRGGPLR